MRLSVMLVVACVSMVGCLSVQRASADAGALIDGADAGLELVWPSRWGLESAGPGVVVEIDGPISAWRGGRHGPWHHRVPRGDDERIVRALAAGRVGEGGYRYRMEGFGAFVFERDPDVPVPPDEAVPGRSEPAFMFVFASGKNVGEREGETLIEVGRTWFAFYDHRRGGEPADGDAGNGVVMLLPGLFGVPEGVVDIVVATMRQRGWNVIRMLAPPARFVERVDLVLDPGERAEESAAEASALLMDRLAETAYAAEGALDYVLDRRPGLAGLPRAIVGGSAGAMSLPAVVRRDPDAYGAAVLIAGGANVLEIVATSSYTKPVGALDFEWAGYENGGTPDRETVREFAEKYLGHAPLDGYHAAAEMRGTLPVLMLQASGDRAVPAALGDVLWDRLGEPERWMTPGSHLTLFMSLWLHTPRIMDWLDSRLVDGVEP